jgi:malate synthase
MSEMRVIKPRTPRDAGKYEEGARLFEKITTDDNYVEFLTLPAYDLID